jgi:hypothetical protein
MSAGIRTTAAKRDPQRLRRAARLSKLSFAGVANIAATADPHWVGTRKSRCRVSWLPRITGPDRPDASVSLYTHRSKPLEYRLFCKHFRARSSENAVLKRAKTRRLHAPAWKLHKKIPSFSDRRTVT